MNYYQEIKEQLINNEIYRKVKDYSKNKNELETYYNVGKIIIEAQGGEERAKYGDNLIKEYSKKLTKELNKKYSITLLKNIRKFYLICQKSPTMSDLLSWSHYVELLKLNNINEINYYINLSLQQNLSVRKLRKKIKNIEYERLSEKAKNKLINNNKLEIQDKIKNPIILKNNHYEIVSEKILKKLILEDIPSFLEQLGNGYSFIKDEYKIKIGDRYNYIDLLLYNIEYNCYVVVELKITELKKEHIGQIGIYMNYIDKNIKKIYQNKTIGIIVCYKNNKFIIEYRSNPRIKVVEHQLE